MDRVTLLFVYGTLRTGTGTPDLDRRLASCLHAVGPAWLPGRLYDLGAYPCAVYLPTCDEHVIGDLYRLSDTSRCLQLLDTYEDHRPAAPERGEFMRQVREVYRPPMGRPTHAWVYLYNGSVRFTTRIRSGDYSRYHRRS